MSLTFISSNCGLPGIGRAFPQLIRSSVENSSQKSDYFLMSVSPRFFCCLITFLGVSQGSKKTPQKIANNSCRKVLTRNRKKIKPVFSRFLLSRFLAFLGQGSSKTPYKIVEKICFNPGPFLVSDPPRVKTSDRLIHLHCLVFCGGAPLRPSLSLSPPQRIRRRT
jgi:hypothetical protein